MNDTEDWIKADWMLTFTGRQFRPLAPRVEDIDIEDIAHSLAYQCRYNGHVNEFYSVAEHSVLVSRAVPEEDALWGLLHDAGEAYVGDMVRPLKRSMPDFAAAEGRILACIATKFDLPTPAIPESVHDADNRILLTERSALLNLNGHRWNEYLESLMPLAVDISAWSPGMAKAQFLRRFEELTR